MIFITVIFVLMAATFVRITYHRLYLDTLKSEGYSESPGSQMLTKGSFITLKINSIQSGLGMKPSLNTYVQFSDIQVLCKLHRSKEMCVCGFFFSPEIFFPSLFPVYRGSTQTEQVKWAVASARIEFINRGPCWEEFHSPWCGDCGDLSADCADSP